MSFHENSRFVVSLSSDIKDTSNRIATIGIEAIETCSSRKWAGLIQIMALSSVLQHTIYSVFPNYSHGIRPLFHGPILPRGTNLHPKCNTFYIMWSRCGKFDNKERALFQPNHFVPLLKSGFDLTDEQDFPFLGSSRVLPSCFNDDGPYCSLSQVLGITGPVSTPSLKKAPLSSPKKKNGQTSTMEQVPGITRPVSKPSSLKKAPLSSPEKKKNGKTSTKEQSSTRHLPSKAKRRRTSLLLTSSGSSPSKTKLEMKLEKNVAKRKSEDGTTTSISINQQPKRPASSVYSQLSFPFLTKKWYRSQVFTQDDGKPTTPPAASNTKTDRNIIESEEILPFTMLSRDWYSTQTMSMNNYSEPVTQETSREKNNIIPLPSMSQLWYKRRGQLAQKNLSRRKCTLVSGTLEENIKNLERDSKNTSMGQTLRERKLSMSNVGKYIIKHGPFVPTQEIGKFMKENKTNFENDPKGRRQMSSEIYKNVSSYLNLMQIYVKGTAYLLENKDYDLSEVTQRLEDICGKSNTEAVNKHINDNVSELLKTAIRFADTKRDADLIKGFFAETTSVKHVAKMLNVQNRSSIRSAEQQLKNKLFEFQNLECASQVVRNDMTNEQQRRLTKNYCPKKTKRI